MSKLGGDVFSGNSHSQNPTNDAVISGKHFTLLAPAVASSTVNIGDALDITNRTVGVGEARQWDAVDITTVTVNGDWIVAHSDPAIALVLRPKDVSNDTLALALADINLQPGDEVSVIGHTTGSVGGATWNTVLVSGVTLNIYDTLQCTGVVTLALELRDKTNVSLEVIGAVVNADITGVIQFAIDNYAESELGDGDFKFNDITFAIKATLTLSNNTTLRYIGNATSPVLITADGVKFLGGSIIPDSASNLRAQRGVIVADKEFLDDLELTVSVSGFQNLAIDFELYAYHVHARKFTNIHMHDFEHSDISSHVDVGGAGNGFCGFIYFRSWFNGSFIAGCSALLHDFKLEHTYSIQDNATYSSDSDGIRCSNTPDFTDNNAVDNHDIVIRDFTVNNCEKRMIKWAALGGIQIRNVKGDNGLASIHAAGNDIRAAGIEMRGGSHRLHNIDLRNVGIYGLLTVDRYEEDAGYTGDISDFRSTMRAGTTNIDATGVEISHSNTKLRNVQATVAPVCLDAVSVVGNRPFDAIPQIVANVKGNIIGNRTLRVHNANDCNIHADIDNGALRLIGGDNCIISGKFSHPFTPFVLPIGSVAGSTNHTINATFEFATAGEGNWNAIVLGDQFKNLTLDMTIVVKGTMPASTHANKTFIEFYSPTTFGDVHVNMQAINSNNAHAILWSAADISLNSVTVDFENEAISLASTTIFKAVSGSSGMAIASLKCNIDAPVGILNSSGGTIVFLNDLGVSKAAGGTTIIGNGLTNAGVVIT